jgi:hypothetical protein
MKKPTIVLSVLSLLLTGVAAWEWQQLSGLRDENDLLHAKVRKLSSATKLVASSPRGPDTARESAPARPGEKGEAATASQGPSGPGRTPEERARFQKMREVQRAQRIESRLLSLSTKLNLTPAQKEAVQAALEKGSKDREALREAAFNNTDGKPPGAEKFAASEKAQEDAILAALTPEQLTAYDEYKQAEKQTRVETRASQQLNELQSSLSLTAEQKDAAFQLFAEQAQTSTVGPAAPGDTEAAKAREAQHQATLTAMEKILTPEQFELYQKQDAQRTELFGNRGPGGPPPGGGPPP